MYCFRKQIRQTSLRGAVIGVLLLFAGSCIGDFEVSLPDSYEWKPSIAFPIGTAEFGLELGQGFDTLLNLPDTSGFPVWAAMPSIPFSGKVQFNFSKVLGEREEMQSLLLRVNAYNGYPLEILVQGYMKNRLGQVVDSLFNPVLIMERGVLAGGGETSEYAHTQVDIYFDEDRLDLLEQTTRIDFIGEVDNIAYFPKFTFQIQLGAVVGVHTEIPL